jgi:MFS family permease
MAIVSACGWAGFMFGPPLIGWLASEFSLPAALWLLPILTAGIAVAVVASRALDPDATAETLSRGNS